MRICAQTLARVKFLRRTKGSLGDLQGLAFAPLFLSLSRDLVTVDRERKESEFIQPSEFG